MSFVAGAITTSLELDTKPFTQGMAQAKDHATSFASHVQGKSAMAAGAIAAIGVAAIKMAADVARSMRDAVTGFAKLADDMGDMSDQVGVSVEFLSGVGAVAKDAGGSVQGLAEAMKFLNKNAADAAEGNEEAMKAFAKVGISVTDGAGNLKQGESLFYELADAIKNLPTAAQQTQTAMALLGRGGSDMIGVLKQGSGAIKDFAADVDRVGGVVSTEAAAWGDKWGKLEILTEAAWTGIKRAVAEPILKAVAENFDEIKQTIIEVSDAIRGAIGEAMADIDWVEVLKEVLNLFKEIAKAIAAIDWRPVIEGLIILFKLAVNLLEILAKIVAFLGGIERSVVGSTVGAGSKPTFGGSSTGTPSTVGTMSTFDFGARGNFGYGEASAGQDFQSRSDRGLTIENLEVNVDPTDATLQLAEKVRGEVKKGMNQLRAEQASKVHYDLVRRGMGMGDGE